MKNIMLVLILLSFTHLTSYSKDNSPLNATQLHSFLEDTTSCFSTNYNVYPQGVLFWRAAWFYYYGLDSSANSLAKNQREFSYNNLQTIINTDGYKGIRVYYGMNSITDTIPVLIIVPVGESCNDLVGRSRDSSVLVSTGDSEYFCSMTDAAKLTKNWRTYSELNSGSIKSMIYAYNYEAEIVARLLTDGINTGGLMFELGLRTISPQEVDFDVSDSNTYGSIIYCNLVYGTIYDPSLGAGRYDFAKPCPHICDFNSPLVTD